MSTIATREDDIRAALSGDPRIPDAQQIAVSEQDGIVTLRGTVGSFRQRRAAVAGAGRVDGVTYVEDELQVRLLNDARRADADIRGIALQILMWDVEVPGEAVDVKVDGGWVTLTGTVTFQFESDAAYDDVTSLVGVLGVTNEIKVITPTM